MAGNVWKGINVPERRRGSERPIAAMGLWYVMSFAVASAAWAVEAAPSDAAGAPLVVHADRWEPPMRTEADILTHRILQRPIGAIFDFRLDTPQAHELAHEIERVLSRIRDSHPVIKDVSVWEREPWSFILHLKPDLYRKVSRAVSLLYDESEPVPFRTGHEQFDTLNTELGLAAIELSDPSFSIAVLYFNKPIEYPWRPLRVYSLIEGVEGVEPNFRLGDGSDINVSKSQGTWYVVVRQAWERGGCLLGGCIPKELFFFIVEEDEVERIESVRAMDMPMFAELVERRWWPGPMKVLQGDD